MMRTHYVSGMFLTFSLCILTSPPFSRSPTCTSPSAPFSPPPPPLSPSPPPSLSLSPQSFSASTAGSTCATIYGTPIKPDDIEGYLWWPNGVGAGKPTLLKADINVDILYSVCSSSLKGHDHIDEHVRFSGYLPRIL